MKDEDNTPSFKGWAFALGVAFALWLRNRKKK